MRLIRFFYVAVLLYVRNADFWSGMTAVLPRGIFFCVCVCERVAVIDASDVVALLTESCFFCCRKQDVCLQQSAVRRFELYERTFPRKCRFFFVLFCFLLTRGYTTNIHPVEVAFPACCTNTVLVCCSC